MIGSLFSICFFSLFLHGVVPGQLFLSNPICGFCFSFTQEGNVVQVIINSRKSYGLYFTIEQIQGHKYSLELLFVCGFLTW